MLISQLVPFGRQQLKIVDVAANLAIAVGAVGNASGRIFSGWLSDTIGRLQTLRLMVGVSILAFLTLPHNSGAAMLYGMVFVVYYCYGTQLSVYASTTGDFFGTKNLGVNYGLLFSAWGVAGIIGPIIAGNDIMVPTLKMALSHSEWCQYLHLPLVQSCPPFPA